MNDKRHHQDTLPQEPPRGNGSDLEAVVMRYGHEDSRLCYMCGHRADEHPIEIGHKGKRRGKCPTGV